MNRQLSLLQKQTSFKVSDLVLLNQKHIKEQYKIIKKLGKGSFGEVWEAKHKQSNELRAIKYLIKEWFNLIQKKQIYKEINILKTLDHPHIVRVIEFFETDQSLQIVMNKIEGKDLF